VDDISIQTQRERILALADREGFDIDQFYVGECCPNNRLEWLKLLLDVTTGAWGAILYLNRSRFCRLDDMENDIVERKMEEVGIRIYTTIEGRLDWGDTAGGIIDKMIEYEEKGVKS
jgi:hypothetical protein